ncbi:MAG TPA: pilus assembly protein PilP [Vulgatibacter sp.]|nr:pilus assembly protein PilP [Vulgatibacter sp.]
MRTTILASLFAVSLLAAACGDDAAPPPAPAPKAASAAAKNKKAKAPKVEEEGAPAEVVEYAYSPAGKRDPFRSVLDEIVVVEAPVVDESCGPLCVWELDQLRVVAVVSGQASPVAMVEDPAGKGHLLRRGMSIGKRSGKVTDIRRDRLVVTEYLRGPQGQVIPTKTEMQLRAKGSTIEKPDVDLTPQDARE